MRKENQTNNGNSDEIDDNKDNEDKDEQENDDDHNKEDDIHGDGNENDKLEVTNMDVYKEDPEPRKQRDKHLLMHMGILNKEEKKKRMLQRKEKGGSLSVKRVMGLVEHTLLVIRLSIQKKNEEKSAKYSGNIINIAGVDDLFFSVVHHH